MNTEEQVRIYDQNIGYLTHSTDFKIEAWNCLVMLYYMSIKKPLEHEGYGWDCQPGNYEVEKTFQFTFFMHFGKRSLGGIRYEEEGGDVYILFRDSVALKYKNSILQLSSIILKIFKETNVRAFVYENGQLHPKEDSLASKKNGLVRDETLKELNKYIVIL